MSSKIMRLILLETTELILTGTMGLLQIIMMRVFSQRDLTLC